MFVEEMSQEEDQNEIVEYNEHGMKLADVSKEDAGDLVECKSRIAE